ncbi:Methionyl-tRNA formyltransferase [Candidatus Sulfotelmatomonas gaucii]|uniref:Methionyl-tRNA formyltransferase n=1 Tax=Candidatus Sulfuritelmatomonas gaucii TaxID=2043161 RepID=A0A2N9LAG7_9BACT|nr:Methionyl-tRNA formyltransferase [Candidatus Sulfotelmatomonas gaucii]
MTNAANRLKLVFCGTPQFGVPTLEALLKAGHEVALVVSQPDRPTGRDHQLTAPAIKQTALAKGLAVTQPEKIRNNAEFRAQLEAIAPDAIVVVAYGRIIPPWMLALPRLGCINLHASLLPKYRGAAPIQWAIASGDAYTGNTTMLLEEGLDTGPVLLQQTMEIGPDQTAAGLFPMMAEAGAPLVVESLAGLANGAIRPEPQSEEGASFAPLLAREDGRMDFAARTAHELYNRWRGFLPWPGAFTFLSGKKLVVHRMAVCHSNYAAGLGFAEPGWILVEDGRLLAACAGNTWLEFLEVQLEGKKRLEAAEFLCGNPLAADARLG